MLSADWFIGMARTPDNLIGNCVATVVVAAWEGDLARTRAQAVLAYPTVISTELSLASEGVGRT